MLYDLNVPWPTNNYTSKPTEEQLTSLRNTIATLHSFGYTHIAINFTIDESIKIPTNGQVPVNPIDTKEVIDATKFPNLKLFTRVTIVINDPSQCQGLSKLQNSFDILAVQPVSERALILCTTNLDIDLISFSMGSKLPFFIKHKTVGSAIEKGIKFEICYSPMIGGSAAYTMSNDNLRLSSTGQLIRKNFFNNALQLIRASRSKGLIVSSGASQPLHVRNSSDIINLLKTLDLDSSRSKACVTLNPEKVLISGRLRVKSYKQTIQIDNDNKDNNVLINNSKENKKKLDSSAYKKRLDDTSSGRLLKKIRTK